MGPQTVREHRYDHHDRANCNHDQETTKLEETTRTTNMVCPKYLCIEDRMLSPEYWLDLGGCGCTAEILSPRYTLRIQDGRGTVLPQGKARFLTTAPRLPPVH